MTYKKDIPASKNYNDFVVFFQYVEIDKNMEPVMVVGAPRYKSAYIIPLNVAYKYADSVTGEPTDYLVQAALTIGETLRLGVDKLTVYRICSAIVDNLPDLVSMPPHSGISQKQLMKEAEQSGLVVKLDGEKIIDAS